MTDAIIDVVDGFGGFIASALICIGISKVSLKF